jgi:outer membrane lipoprotein LolB
MRLWPILLAGLWLAGCAAPVPEPVPVSSQEQVRQQQKLEQIDAWRLQGRMAVINGVEAWHMNLDWQQRQEEYQIELWGPFGSGRVQLQGDEKGVRLFDSQQQIYYADDPENLLFEHTGVKMPVSGLRYWILGLTDPRYSQEQSFRDAAGRLTVVQQDNWQVEFKRYSRVDGMDLPDRLSVDKQDLLVKLVVDNWQVSDDSP